MKTGAPDLFENQTEISQGRLGVVENSADKSVPEKAGKNTRKFPSDRGSNALGCACDDCDFTCEFIHMQ
jgi:hypothetical protein